MSSLDAMVCFLTEGSIKSKYKTLSPNSKSTLLEVLGFGAKSSPYFFFNMGF